MDLDGPRHQRQCVMPCLHGDGFVLCTPTTFNWRTVRPCSTCDQRRWMLVEEAVWYGATITCLACGDAWSDGERLPRPFSRRWREEAVARARKRPYAAKAIARENLHDEIEMYCEPDVSYPKSDATETPERAVSDGAT